MIARATHHTPIIRLQAARQHFEAALQCCPHWDFEDGGHAGHGCCHELEEARRELSNARRAAKVAA